jgi:hydrogenase nickel incorporation protein HypA/HybF
MHEYSIVLSMLKRVEAEAKSRDAIAVHKVIVRVGRLSGVEAELLSAAFSIAREGTVCAAADLEVHTVEVAWACPRCKRSIAVGEVLQCPECEVPASLQSGDEILLEQIEMEVA